jgi:hypothetical protein
LTIKEYFANKFKKVQFQMKIKKNVAYIIALYCPKWRDITYQPKYFLNLTKNYHFKTMQMIKIYTKNYKQKEMSAIQEKLLKGSLNYFKSISLN